MSRLIQQSIERPDEQELILSDGTRAIQLIPEHWAPPLSLLGDLQRIEIRLRDKKHELTEEEAAAEIRDLVQRRWTSLVDLTRSLHQYLATGAGYAVLTGFPLGEEASPLRNVLALCFASSIGQVTSADVVTRKVIWEVTPRNLPGWHRPTISEHNEEGHLHTDSQYRRQPERYFALFAINPAKDGGGETILVKGRDIIDRLELDAVGQKHLNTLRTHRFPFRVPTSFTEHISEGENEYVFAPIIGEIPLFRFRRDTLSDGMKDNPQCDNADAQEAITHLCNIIDTEVEKTTLLMKRGDILLVNNHEMLHGRTAFTDRSRLLLRIRMN